MSRLLYTLLIALASGPASMLLALRDRRLQRAGHGWLERFGRVPPGTAPVAVWIHAASLGEVLAAAPLIQRLLAQHGERQVAVSCFTATGSQQIRRAWGERVVHAYLPFDLPAAVNRFLSALAPRRAIIIETELWPNLYRAVAARGIPLVIANARLSERSLRGYRRLPGLIGEALGACTLVAAQSDDDAARFRALGARTVTTTGNIKFDVEVPSAQLAQGAALRAQLGTDRPIWIAASTHEGEEAAALTAHSHLLQSQPDALLILVPRHPQRFEACWNLLAASGLRGARRSEDGGNAQTQVYFGDSLGEMFVYLGAADLAFVGGSLAAIGGHNILEPAAVGVPVLFGPHMQNFAAARQLLLGRGGTEVGDAAALAAALSSAFADRHRLRAEGQAAQEAVAANRGALQNLLRALTELPTPLP
ncbi:MAG TPA: lipid IV(A) 3-deoxy-D-manno-octulosonic acid transferase [Fontimonas sp.]